MKIDIKQLEDAWGYKWTRITGSYADLLTMKSIFGCGEVIKDDDIYYLDIYPEVL